MPIRYVVNRDRNCIFETWEGTVSGKDLEAYWKRYLADPEVLGIRRTVVDLRAAEMAFTGFELQALVENLVTPMLNGRDWKTAIVVAEPVQFGVSRQYQVFAGHYSKDAIFSDVAAAQRWLSSQ